MSLLDSVLPELRDMPIEGYYDLSRLSEYIWRFSEQDMMELCRNEEFVRKAVLVRAALEFCGPEFRNNREIVLLAIEYDGRVLRWASDELKNDEYIAWTAVQQKSEALQYVNRDAIWYRDFVLRIVRVNGWALQFAGSSLQNDQDVVRTAMHREPRSFRYAGDDLKRDKSFVLEVMGWCGNLLQYVHAGLRNDQDVVRAAMHCEHGSFRYAGDGLKRDKSFVMEVMGWCGNLLQFVHADLLDDPDIVEAAIRRNHGALQYAGNDVKKNRAVVSLAVSKYPADLVYAEPSMREDLELTRLAFRTRFSDRELKSALGLDDVNDIDNCFTAEEIRNTVAKMCRYVSRICTCHPDDWDGWLQIYRMTPPSVWSTTERVFSTLSPQSQWLFKLCAFIQRGKGKKDREKKGLFLLSLDVLKEIMLRLDRNFKLRNEY